MPNRTGLLFPRHCNCVSWTVNTAANGPIVNGDDDVAMYGLFVENVRQYQTVRNGERGRTCFYQNGMPDELPNQAAPG